MSIMDRVLGLITLGTVRRATAPAGARGTVQFNGMLGLDEAPRVEPYGLQSRPIPGAEQLVLAVGGSGDDVVALVVGDRRYNIALAAGEVAIVDDLGQRVHLGRDGITVYSRTVLLGPGPAYRRPVLVGDTITGLTSATGGAVTGIIAASAATDPVSVGVS